MDAGGLRVYGSHGLKADEAPGAGTLKKRKRTQKTEKQKQRREAEMLKRRRDQLDEKD